MEPLLKTGDRILLSKTPFGSLRKGDIVLAEISGRKVCHRVVGFAEQGRAVLLRGDASFSRPDRVPESAYLGKVSAIVKSSGPVSLETWWRRLQARLGIYLFPAVMSAARILLRMTGRCG